MTLSVIRNNLKSIEFNKIIQEGIFETKNEIVEYQKGQMLRGLKSTGAIIGKYKNKDYAIKKANMNPLAGINNVDLRLTGEFQRNIKLKFFSSSFEIFSTDWKFEELSNKYGNEIFGLSVPYRAEYSELYLAEKLTKKIKNHINGM